MASKCSHNWTREPRGRLICVLALTLALALPATAADWRLDFALDGRRLEESCGGTGELLLHELRGSFAPGGDQVALQLVLSSPLPLSTLQARLGGAGLTRVAESMEAGIPGEYRIRLGQDVPELPPAPATDCWLFVHLQIAGGRVEFQCGSDEARLHFPGPSARAMAVRLAMLTETESDEGWNGALRRLLASLHSQDQADGELSLRGGGWQLAAFAREIRNLLLEPFPVQAAAEDLLCRDQRQLLLLAARLAQLTGRPLKSTEELLEAGFLLEPPLCPAGGNIELQTDRHGDLRAFCSRHPDSPPDAPWNGSE